MIMAQLALVTGIAGALALAADPAVPRLALGMHAATATLLLAGELTERAAVIVRFDGAGVLETVILSGLAGYLLWLALPRGVILTKTPPPADADESSWDRWTVRNESPVTIQVVRVALVTIGGESDMGDHLTFDDETLEVRRQDWEKPWEGLEIPPGETLTAHVPVNHTMSIKYRRAGPVGWVERRELVIHGAV